MDLLKARVWFADAWGKIGQLGTLCVKADEAEISAAGVELLLLSVELASKKGNANVGGLRAGDNMAVVNGRLQNMDGVGFDDVVKGAPPAIATDRDEEEDDEYEGGSAEVQAHLQLLYLAAFEQVEQVPAVAQSKAEGEEDLLGTFSDGLGHLYTCCANYEMAAAETPSNRGAWVLGRFIKCLESIATRCSALSKSKYVMRPCPPPPPPPRFFRPHPPLRAGTPRRLRRTSSTSSR